MGNSLPHREQEIYHGNSHRRENALLDIPWRMFEDTGSWTKEYRHALIQYICSTIPRDDVGNLKFLLIGPVSAGKSSFLNAVASIDAEETTQVVGCGEGNRSFTQKDTLYTADQKLKNFILCDTMGIEEKCYDGQFSSRSDWIRSVLEGYSKPEDCEFNSRQDKKIPSIADKIHCVALVIDSECISLHALSDSVLWMLERMTADIRIYGCPVVVILTKIDKVSEEVNRNISKTFNSRNVERCVKKANKMFGIPVMNIYPVQNYTEQMGLDYKMDILILMAIKHMIKLANGYIKILRNNSEDVKQKTSMEDAEPRKSSKDAEQKNSSKDAEQKNSSKDAEQKNSSKDAEQKNSSEDAEQRNSSEDAEQRNSSKNAELKNSSEDAEHRNSSKGAELKNSSEDAEHRISSKDAEQKNSSEDAEQRNSSEDVEQKNSSEDAEQKNSSKNSEQKNSSEDAKQRNSSKDAEQKNSSKDAEQKNSSDDAKQKDSSKEVEHRNSSKDAEHRDSSKDRGRRLAD